MRKLLVAAIVTTILAVPISAEAKGRGPCVNLRMRATIVCAVKLWPSDLDALLYIAGRESGFYPGAVSPSGTYLGVFQIGSYHMPAWPAELMPQPWFRQWFPNVDYSDPAALLNGRFNVFLAVRFAHSLGLGPWQ